MIKIFFPTLFSLCLISSELYAQKKIFRSDYIQRNIKLLIGKNIEKAVFAAYINELFTNLNNYLKVKNLECSGIVDIGLNQEKGIIWETKNFKLTKSEKEKCLYEQYLYELEMVEKIYKKRRYYTVLNHREELSVLEEFHGEEKSKIQNRVDKMKKRIERHK